jgi:hypothetical protein
MSTVPAKAIEARNDEAGTTNLPPGPKERK